MEDKRTCRKHSSPLIPDYQWLLHHGNTIFLIELLRDQFIRKDKTPERGFRGLTILSSIVVCLQWLVFGLTRKQVCLFAFKICKEKNIPHTFKNETADMGWMYVCNFSDPLKQQQRTTNLSYGRLIIFNNKICSDFGNLFGQTLDSMHLHTKAARRLQCRQK